MAYSTLTPAETATVQAAIKSKQLIPGPGYAGIGSGYVVGPNVPEAGFQKQRLGALVGRYNRDVYATQWEKTHGEGSWKAASDASNLSWGDVVKGAVGVAALATGIGAATGAMTGVGTAASNVVGLTGPGGLITGPSTAISGSAPAYVGPTLGEGEGLGGVTAEGGGLTAAQAAGTPALSGGVGGATTAGTVPLTAGQKLTAEQIMSLAGNPSALKEYVNSGMITASDFTPEVMAALSAAGTVKNTGLLDSIAKATGLSVSDISKLATAGLGLAAYSVVSQPQQNQSQYVVDPVTGKVTSSSVTGPSGTTTSLDPRITNLQNQYLAQNTANLGELTTNLAPVKTAQTGLASQYQDLYQKAGAGQGGYVQSVIDPLKQQAATEYGNLVQNQGMRGLGGSSIATGALANYTTDTGRAIADATAKATQESLGLQQGITTAQAGLTRDQLNTMLAQFNAGDTSNAGVLKAAGMITDTQLAAMRMGTTGAAATTAGQTAQRDAQGRIISGIGNALGQSNALSIPAQPAGMTRYNYSTGQWEP